MVYQHRTFWVKANFCTGVTENAGIGTQTVCLLITSKFSVMIQVRFDDIDLRNVWGAKYAKRINKHIEQANCDNYDYEGREHPS